MPHTFSFFAAGLWLTLLGLVCAGLSVKYTEPKTSRDLFVPFLSGLIGAGVGIAFVLGSFVYWGYHTLP